MYIYILWFNFTLGTICTFLCLVYGNTYDNKHQTKENTKLYQGKIQPQHNYVSLSIRLIADTMDFTKTNDIPGIAVFLDFEKAFDSVEWDFIQKCLESFNFGPNLRQWISVFYKDISSCVINNGVASQHFYLERGVRQGCPLSGILFVIAMELLAQSIRRSKDIKGINIQGDEVVKLSQYADDTTPPFLKGSRRCPVGF